MKCGSGWRRRAASARGVALGAGLALALGVQAAALSQAQPSKPIIVKIPQDPPKSELSGLADVLLGSLGLTGVIVIAAVVLGALLAGVMFWVRSRQD
jgi:ABC-type phosphate transport system permease subunit